MILKIPEIEKALDIIGTLRKEKGKVLLIVEVTVDFMLADSVWVKGKGTPGLKKIALWLGANTMVELTFDEAESMLRENLTNAKSNLKEIQEDLNYVKDQVTTSEVNISRVYNYSLLEKRL
jgi:prefoldin subunit 5